MADGTQAQPTALYRFYGADGDLLYVGISHRLNERLSKHKRQKPWHLVARVELEHHLSREAAADAERAAIQNEKPAWNVMHNGGRHEPTDYSVDVTDAQVDGLAGHFFHSFTEHDDGCRTVDWQGQVLARIEPGTYLVERYEWLMGEPSDRRIVPIGDMLGWSFYEDAEWMKWQYTYGGLSSRSDSHDQHVIGSTEISLGRPMSVTEFLELGRQ